MYIPIYPIYPFWRFLSTQIQVWWLVQAYEAHTHIYPFKVDERHDFERFVPILPNIWGSIEGNQNQMLHQLPMRF